MVHSLKCWPVYYDAIARGEKTFEVRKNDRGFKVGDEVALFPWDPEKKTFTGQPALQFRIDYVLHAGEFPEALREGYVVLSLAPSWHDRKPEPELEDPRASDMPERCAQCGQRHSWKHFEAKT